MDDLHFLPWHTISAAVIVSIMELPVIRYWYVCSRLHHPHQRDINTAITRWLYLGIGLATVFIVCVLSIRPARTIAFISDNYLLECRIRRTLTALILATYRQS